MDFMNYLYMAWGLLVQYLVTLAGALAVTVPVACVVTPIVKKIWNAPDKKKAQDQETP